MEKLCQAIDYIFNYEVDNVSLEDAVMLENIVWLDYLIKYGKNKNEALELACQHGQIKIVKHLIDTGVNIHYDNEMALCIAAEYGQLNIVKLLISYHADFSDGEALLQACQYGHLTTAAYLIEQRSPIHEDTLMLAAQNDHYEVVTLLLKHINIPEQINRAILIAEAVGNRQVVELLKKQT